MTSIRTHVATTSTAIAALLLLGAWYAPALAYNGITAASEEAATDSVPTAAIEAASPRLIEKTNAPLHEIGVRDDSRAAAKPAEKTESSPQSIFTKYKDLESEAKEPIETSAFEGNGEHLPDVSNVSLPRFRREMYRTDI